MHPPRPPGNLPTSEWNSRTTGPVFTVFSSVVTDLGDGRQRETREIYRPKERGDSPSLIYQGHRWTKISRVTRNTTPPPTTPPPPVFANPGLPQFGTGANIGSIFNPASVNAPFQGPLPPNFTQQTTTTPPTFNQGLAGAITALVPAEYQAPVNAVLTSVLGTGPTTTVTPTVPNTPPAAGNSGTTAPPPPEENAEGMNPAIRNAIVLTVAVGAVYFFFIRK